MGQAVEGQGKSPAFVATERRSTRMRRWHASRKGGQACAFLRLAVKEQLNKHNQQSSKQQRHPEEPRALERGRLERWKFAPCLFASFETPACGRLLKMTANLFDARLES
jgi:hypothetical protein